MHPDKEAYQLPYSVGEMWSHDHFCNTYRPFIDMIVRETESKYPLGEFSCGDARTTKALMYMLPEHRFNLYDIVDVKKSVDKNLQDNKFKYEFTEIGDYMDDPYKKEYHELIYTLGIFNFLEYSTVNKIINSLKPCCSKMVHLVWGEKAREIFDYPIRLVPMADWIQNLDTRNMFSYNHQYYYLLGWRA